MDCIFCKIIKGEIPSKTVYEDEIVKVFLDVNPCSNGHLLIIPKEHYKNLFNIPNEVILHSISLIREKIYPILQKKLNCKGISICQNNDYGQDVKHYHIHVIPRYDNDEIKIENNKKLLVPIDEIYDKLKS